MANKYKYSFALHSAWNYQNEVEEMDKYSENGWQLVKAALFHRKYVKNEKIRYRYQLDFRRIEDKGRYIETFREQGWEYVDSTINGWHYFRKIYDPSLPEEEYEIFTDRESFNAMKKNWARIALVIAILGGIMALIYGIKLIMVPSVPFLLLFLTFLIEFSVLFRGVLIMRAKESKRKRNRYRDSVLITVFFLTIILGTSSGIFLSGKRPNITVNRIPEANEESVNNERFGGFEVKYPDNYFLDLGIESKDPMTFEVVNESGETVYKITDSSFHEDDIRLNLKKGTYYFSMSCDTYYNLSCNIN